VDELEDAFVEVFELVIVFYNDRFELEEDEVCELFGIFTIPELKWGFSQMLPRFIAR